MDLYSTFYGKSFTDLTLGFKHLAAIPPVPFPRLCSRQDDEGSLGLSERLGGLEMVRHVLQCQEVTPGSAILGKLRDFSVPSPGKARFNLVVKD